MLPAPTAPECTCTPHRRDGAAVVSRVAPAAAGAHGAALVPIDPVVREALRGRWPLTERPAERRAAIESRGNHVGAERRGQPAPCAESR